MSKRPSRRQSPPLDPVIEAVVHAHERWSLFPSVNTNTPQTVVVGVSGGADSICLLHALLQLRERWQLDLHVAHLDHALRPDSAMDAEFVGQVCERWHLPFHQHRILPGVIEDWVKYLGSVEAACRFERFDFLCSVVGQVSTVKDTTALALAHHADDQAETVLFRLIRGSGLHGLGGIRPLMFYPHFEQYVRVVRPLIDVRRTEIIRYLNEHQLEWREDASNKDVTFARNRLRHSVLPELEAINSAVVDTITRTASILAENAARLDALDQALLATVRLNPINTPRTVLDLEKWLTLPSAEQRATLRIAIRERLWRERNLEQVDEETGWGEEATFVQIETLRQQVLKTHSTRTPRTLIGNLKWSVLPKSEERPRQLILHSHVDSPIDPDYPHFGDSIRRTIPLSFSNRPNTSSMILGDWYLLCIPISASDLPANWQQNQNPWQAWIDLDTVTQLAITTPQQGQKVSPLGMDGQQKSLGDFFTDRKVPNSLRAGWPIVIDCNQNSADRNSVDPDIEVVWVCGHMISHRSRITEQTTRVLHMHWQFGDEALPTQPTKL